MAFDSKPNLNNDKFEQFSGETLTLRGTTEVHGRFEVESGGTFQLDDGNQQPGYVMTSNALGEAYWSAPQSGITNANNGIVVANATVSLGGSLTGNTVIDMNGFGLAMGNNFFPPPGQPLPSATGDSSIAFGISTKSFATASFAMGCRTRAYGIASFSHGDITSACGSFSHAEGSGSNSLGIGSHAEGDNTYSCGNHSHAEGFLTNSIGGCSHAEGYKTCSIGNYSHAEGNCTRAYGINSHSEGKYTCAVGDNSHSEGNVTNAIGINSHSEGKYTIAIGAHSHSEGFNTNSKGIATHSGGYGEISNSSIYACGKAAFIHSTNTSGQTLGYGANADYSAILGGQDHNIESGNTRAVIIGGNAIKLTGTTYVDTTAVDNLAIMTEPTSGSSDQVLIRNTSTGKIEYVNKSSLSTTANNGLAKIGNNIVLGGTLTGTTIIETTLSYGFGIGNNVVSNGFASVALGRNSKAYGIASFSSNSGRAYGINSSAEGASVASGASSHAEGVSTYSIGSSSHAQGNTTCAIGNDSHSSGGILSNAGNTKGLCAAGCTSFIHSYNDTAQIAGHGALANQSAILGGRNHNIESGNTRAAIIGGDTIKLTGTTYVDTTAVSKLAIMSTPTSGNSTQILARNPSTGIIEITSVSGGGGADGVVSGATLNNTILELSRTEGLNDVTVDLSGLTTVSTNDLTDSTTITFDFESKYTGIKRLTTTNTSITLTLTNIVEGASQTLSVVKNTASDVIITLAGTGLSFYGYNYADYGTTPNIVLSGSLGNRFDISFLAVTPTIIGVAIGENGN